MEAARTARSLFLLLSVALIGLHPPAGELPSAGHLAGTSASPQSLISAPRQSLPIPAHDEATCAFCQAAAFAPHPSGSGAVPVIALGPERWESLSQSQQVTPAGSVRSPRSRGPPVLPNV